MARKPKKKNKSAPVEALVHKNDKRANIPTRELADFVVKEEQATYARRYSRDPSLDPQLVWKGNDEQDGEDLEVPTVPIRKKSVLKP